MATSQSAGKSQHGLKWTAFVALLSSAFVTAGCHWKDGKVDRPIKPSAIELPSAMLTREIPAVACDVPTPELISAPTALRDFQTLQPHAVTLEEAIRCTLQNSKVLQKLGGQVVSAPAATSTIYDPAFTASNPQLSTEAALSAFDAQFATSSYLDHSERRFNNPFFGGGASSLISETGTFRTELSKATAVGTTFAIRNSTDYSKNNSPVNLFPGVWDTVTVAEVRQPLLAGAGIDVNRIAGPNAVIGNYNGVLIARIREDISVADFEAAVRDLVRDVEQTYWQLYFAYQDLDTKLLAQEAARETWENRKKRLDSGVGRPDEEAQARQQYYSFRSQVENAVAGTSTGVGLYTTERQLRRLMDLPLSDGTIIRPTSAPQIAPITFDWEHSQQLAMENRVEVRRQRWTLRQSELELVAAKNLSQWRMDIVANYGWRGFGDNLIGNAGAVKDQLAGDLDDWRLGFEFGGPVGRRAGHVAVRNAELKLARDRVRLEEQQKQILNNLANAYSEVDRAFSQIRTAVNTRIAIQEELEPKRRRVEAGTDDVFFLLDVQQRAATAESNVHRAITDYNIALLNYQYQSGTLLSNYSISLDECPSQARLYEAAQIKATFFEPGSAAPIHKNVSAGPYYGSPASPGMVTGFPSAQSYQMDGGTAPDAPAVPGMEPQAPTEEPASDKELDDLERRLQELLKEST